MVEGEKVKSRQNSEEMNTDWPSELAQPKIRFFLAKNECAKNKPWSSPSLQPWGKDTVSTFSEAPQRQREESNRIMIATVATCAAFMKLELEGDLANAVIEQTDWRQALPS